jgi:hypothetical protein
LNTREDGRCQEAKRAGTRIAVPPASDGMRNALPSVVVGHFKHGDAVPVYRRFGERGRMAPDGLRYVKSWWTGTTRVVPPS